MFDFGVIGRVELFDLRELVAKKIWRTIVA